MSKADLSLPLLPNHYYHIFNRGNEKRNIFFEYKNYQYFLKRYVDYTSAYLDTYSYCLLDNHFHLLIKPKSTNEILQAASVDFGILDASFGLVEGDRYAWTKQKFNSSQRTVKSYLTHHQANITSHKKNPYLIPAQILAKASLPGQRSDSTNAFNGFFDVLRTLCRSLLSVSI